MLCLSLAQAPLETLGFYAAAAIQGRGLLEPFYRLHASRLKVLLRQPSDPEVLQAVASAAFQPETAQLIQSVCTHV